MCSQRLSTFLGLFIFAAAVAFFGILSPKQESSVRAQEPEKKNLKEGKPDIKKELETLREIFGGRKVNVFSKDHGPYEGVISGLVDVFGVRFLRIVNDRGTHHIIRTDLIMGIRGD